MPPASSQDLIDRLRARTARLGVIGLGYVGLPLAVEFAKAGFATVGFDVDEDKVRRVLGGDPCGVDVSRADVEALTAGGRLNATTDFTQLAGLDSVDICEPTPLRKTKDPDLSHIVAAVGEIARHLHAGQLVVLESTTYPGTVEEVVRPMLEEGGLRGGEDFFLAFSPERIDPGNQEWTTANIPKVVGGIDAASTAVAQALYEQVVSTVVPVSSTRVAEMVKLLENTFRAVNIGLVNELALMSHEIGVDVWEVIDAAGTKPFGFMPFYPGPGLGGHCIPIDPYYLSWKARQNGFESRFIELAGHINSGMPRFIVERVVEALSVDRKPLRHARVHLFGIAYKPGVGDVRESPALDIARLLQRGGAIVSYSDPFVPTIEQGEVVLEEVPCETALEQGFDCAVITTSHAEFDYGAIASRAPRIVDTRNALKGFSGDH
ncbi:MAG: nucleotide sugar dehydrogenase, partial [Acidobacteriota bacterium]|nr:nucleotide sugar dehydrogenase [Acidobacteriota bacterium]